MHTIVATLLLVSTIATFARASTPCECPDSTTWVLPAEGAPLPPNARLFLSARGLDEASLELTDAGGAAVPFDVARDGGLPAHQLWIVPRGPLSGASLDLRFRVAGFADETTYAWTIAGEADTSAPTLGAASVAPAHLDGACETHIAAAVTLTGASADAQLVHVRLLPGAAATPPQEVWLPVARPVFGRFTAADWQSCLSNFPSAADGASWSAEVSIIDAAGQASASVPAGSFVFDAMSNAPADSSCAAGGDALVSLLPGLLVLLLRRRGARRHALRAQP